jgi:lipid II:glycine glycyltransferase (peptidoglycan interpeptide bridge formation enzyme)
MYYSLKEITDKGIWEDFNTSHINGYFLQSWYWGEFQKELGHEVDRIGFYRGKTLVGICQVIIEKDKLGKIAYTSRGPIVDFGRFDAAIEGLIDRYRDTSCILIRMDPVVLDVDEERKGVFASAGFRSGVRTVQVEDAWMLNIGNKDDDELFRWMKESGMRKKVPNYIRGSIKKGVKIYEAKNEVEVGIFTAMIDSMGSVKGLRFGTEDYFKKMWNANRGNVKIYIGEFNDIPVVSALVISYGTEVAYLYGASTPDIGNSNAAYLLQWEIMKKAREEGIQRYNMWGVVTGDDYQPGKPAYGYSYFKRSFGGYIEKYMRVQEYPYNRLKYQLFRIREKRRMKAAKKIGVM